jgi:hypothetical protein
MQLAALPGLLKGGLAISGDMLDSAVAGDIRRLCELHALVSIMWLLVTWDHERPAGAPDGVSGAAGRHTEAARYEQDNESTEGDAVGTAATLGPLLVDAVWPGLYGSMKERGNHGNIKG